jgi:hypothetical protein
LSEKAFCLGHLRPGQAQRGMMPEHNDWRARMILFRLCQYLPQSINAQYEKKPFVEHIFLDRFAGFPIKSIAADN